jgi:hypothetical protein
VSAQHSEGGLRLVAFATSFQQNSDSIVAGTIYSYDAGGLVEHATPGGPLLEGTDAGLAALSIDEGRVYFVTRTQTVLGGISVTPQDVLVREDGNLSVLLDGSESGIPPRVRITAIDKLSGGPLLLSFSNSFSWGNEVIRRGDIASISPGQSAQPSLAVERENVFGQCTACFITSLSASYSPDLIFRSYFYDPWEGSP